MCSKTKDLKRLAKFLAKNQDLTETQTGKVLRYRRPKLIEWVFREANAHIWMKPACTTR